MLFRSVLSNERAGISDYSSKEIGPEPAHGQCRSTTRAATHNASAPRIVRDGNVRVGGLYLWIVQNLRQDFVVDESGKALRIPTKADTCSNPKRTPIPIDIGQLSERSDALGLVINKCPI